MPVNSKEENFSLDFVQEFGLWIGENDVYLPFFLSMFSLVKKFLGRAT